MSDGGDHADLQSRVEAGDLSMAELAAIIDTLDAKVDQMLLTRVENLEETVNEQGETIDGLQADHEETEDRVGTLEQKFAGLAGLKEHEQTTAEKRREDLVLALQRKAEDGAGKDDNGLASMTYEAVLDQWAVLNHGRLDPKQAYRAMEQVADIRGISLTTNDDEQKVVRFNQENFDPSTAHGVIDNVNNAEGSRTATNAVTPSD